MSLDRRTFLKLSGYFTVSAAGTLMGACGGGEEQRAVSAMPAGTYSYPQGIGSGDPRADSVVLWTRVAGGSSGADVSVRVQLSERADFAQLLMDVPVVVSQSFDSTVRHKVVGLQPYRYYYYRFIAGNDVSPTGRTKTAPLTGTDGEPQQVRFAVLNCQSWTANHWEAMRLITEEDDLDFVVNLGDYIYDLTSASGRVEAAHPPLKLPDGFSFPLPGAPNYRLTTAVTLADYRYLYQTYRSDPRLQKLHARFPMISIWDDHEFADDCWLDHETYTGSEEAQPQRRRDATQAWFEYMAVDINDVQYDPSSSSFQNIRLNRAFSFGSVMDLVITDQRLFREDHPVPEGAVPPPTNFLAKGSRYLIDKATLDYYDAKLTAATGSPPSILGTAQTAWLKDALLNSTATWKVWGSEVTFLKLNVQLPNTGPQGGEREVVVYGDSWEGYPLHKKDITKFIRANGISNVVSVSGDIHAFMAGTVMDDQDAPGPSPVMTDFVSAGISSATMYSLLKTMFVQAEPAMAPLVQQKQADGTMKNIWDATARQYNPELAYTDFDAIGYVSVTVTKDKWSAVLNKVNQVTQPGVLPSPILQSRTRLDLPAGSFAIQVTPL
ncbi:alkaline phosphatase D family protein [Cupriavidus sp. TMH.W2]|uniref:alkaline phosphatase D family protein n=1 Tax=Cupriavidus sp. TMH.W2 TaxID=3434465 RepID=UPI003D7745F5